MKGKTCCPFLYKNFPSSYMNINACPWTSINLTELVRFETIRSTQNKLKGEDDAVTQIHTC